MASGGLSTLIRSLYCSVDCQMSSRCCLCYPYRHQKTKIYTRIKPCQGRVYLWVPCSNPNKEKGNSLPLQKHIWNGIWPPNLSALSMQTLLYPFYRHSTYHLPLLAISPEHFTRWGWHSSIMQHWCSISAACWVFSSLRKPLTTSHTLLFIPCDVFLTNFTCTLPLSSYPYSSHYQLCEIIQSLP